MLMFISMLKRCCYKIVEKMFKHLQSNCVKNMCEAAHLAAAGTSLHEPGADHVVSEEVGVGVPADPVIDDGLPQALEPVRIVF